MRRAIIYLLVLIIFVSAACNFPTRSRATMTQTAAAPTLPAASPTPTLFIRATATITAATQFDLSGYVEYHSQSGDTLDAVASHFGVLPGEIYSPQTLQSQSLLPLNQILYIPDLNVETPYRQPLLPDSEIVDSACGSSFDIQSFITNSSGKLKTYTQTVDSMTLSGAGIVQRVAEETSVNPHFLLAFIEFRSQWVSGQAGEPDVPYPLALDVPGYEGLYRELSLTAKLVNMGYYAWRQGSMTMLTFTDGSSVRIAPELNAGTVGLQYLFARLYKQTNWLEALYGPSGFLATYERLFGDPNACPEKIGPLFPDNLQPPTLELPFASGEEWALTGGLHNDWNTGTPLGALDFAPVTGEPPCTVSRAWVRASAPGVVTRSENSVVQLALVDGSGKANGWELLYLHIADADRVAVGKTVQTGDLLGHPSCEGGEATGTHVHIARLYHGEWIGASGPFPLILSGWLSVPGKLPYQSTMVKGDQVVIANPGGNSSSIITH